MKPKLYLRIAAAFTLLHTAGHLRGALGANKAPNERVAAVIAGMNSEHFDFMGRSATIGGFYMGYGIMFIFVLLLISFLLWYLSSRPVRTIQLALAGYLLTQAIAEYSYFFPFAALISGLAAILTALSAFKVPQASLTAAPSPD